jgi:ATP-dependent protease ClpP protease subunit
MNITNKADKAIIEIYGDIGEGWFDEGVTLKNVNDKLKNITTPEIELRVNSLGGDLNDALVIHDILKLHPAKVTTKILGATASSGTVIAMAGDEILMSENALFLVHNASTMAMGNASEMRETAENLDKWDDRIINIYKKKTGKRKSQIESLMKEEKWIDASEAKEFGFINNTFEPEKIAASLTEARKAQILNDLKTKKTEMDIKKELSDLKNWITENFKSKEKPEDFETTVNDKLSTMESNIENLTGEKDTLNTSIVDLTENLATEKAEHETVKAELETVKAEKETLETELGKIKATKTGLDQTADPVDPNDKNVNTALGTEMSDMFTDEQKETLKYNKKNK